MKNLGRALGLLALASFAAPAQTVPSGCSSFFVGALKWTINETKREEKEAAALHFRLAMHGRMLQRGIVVDSETTDELPADVGEVTAQTIDDDGRIVAIWVEVKCKKRPIFADAFPVDRAGVLSGGDPREVRAVAERIVHAWCRSGKIRCSSSDGVTFGLDYFAVTPLSVAPNTAVFPQGVLLGGETALSRVVALRMRAGVAGTSASVNVSLQHRDSTGATVFDTTFSLGGAPEVTTRYVDVAILGRVPLRSIGFVDAGVGSAITGALLLSHPSTSVGALLLSAHYRTPVLFRGLVFQAGCTGLSRFPSFPYKSGSEARARVTPALLCTVGSALVDLRQ